MGSQISLTPHNCPALPKMQLSNNGGQLLVDALTAGNTRIWGEFRYNILLAKRLHPLQTKVLVGRLVKTTEAWSTLDAAMVMKSITDAETPNLDVLAHTLFRNGQWAKAALGAVSDSILHKIFQNLGHRFHSRLQMLTRQDSCCRLEEHQTEDPDAVLFCDSFQRSCFVESPMPSCTTNPLLVG